MTHSGGKPHAVGDRGQRYKVTFIDGNNQRATLGWSESATGALGFIEGVKAHPVWSKPQVYDRITFRIVPEKKIRELAASEALGLAMRGESNGDDQS